MVAAGPLLRRPAGMENGGPFVWRQTGQFQFLERRCGHDGDLRPMLDHVWLETARFADFSIRGVVFELQREEFERQFTEGRFISVGRALRISIQALKFEVRSSPVFASLRHGWNFGLPRRSQRRGREFGVTASWNSALRKNGLAQ